MIQKSFVFFLYSNIVKRTPVDTGRARSNWNVSIGSPNTKITDDVNRRVSFNEIPDADGGPIYFITNNLPYIRTLEYGGYPSPVKKGSWDKKQKRYVVKSANGFSKQAPNGMLGVTVAEADRIYRQAISAIRGVR